MKRKHGKPYKVLCISMYLDDIGAVDVAVATLKQKGQRNMSRSRLIRVALEAYIKQVLP